MEPNEVLAPHYRKKEGNKKLRDPAVACGRPSPSAATLTHHAVESHTRAPSTDLARKKKKKTTDAILRLIENNAGAVLRSQVPVDTPHRHKTRTHTKKRGSERMRHPPPPTKDSGNKRQFSKMVISAGLKQEQRAPSSYLKAINAPYRPYYISLTFSPFIYIARDFFFVLFCYCFLLSCVKARAALNFFFSFLLWPGG